MAALSLVVRNAVQAAVSDFKANLNNDKVYAEICAIQTVDDVYDFTDELQKKQGESRRLRHLSKIETYLSRLRDFAGAVDVFVQVEPKILGLIWGPIKLLLQWSSVVTHSFDRIVNTCSDIGDLLPEFEKVTSLFAQNTKLYDLLVLFLKDILEFYSVWLQTFTRKRTYNEYILRRGLKADHRTFRVERILPTDLAPEQRAHRFDQNAH